MKIAHIGPPLAQTGGPAGYLRQLESALGGPQASDADLELIFPEHQPPAAQSREPWISRARRPLGKLKRVVVGAPRQFRPSIEECVRRDGPIGRLVTESTEAEIEAARPSFERALDAGADVFFTHSSVVAEWVRAQTSKQVWLMLHSPIPHALYLAWSWGLPEESWQRIAGFEDVRAGIDRELAVCQRVDRLMIPCPEALDELARVDRRFADLAGRAEYLLTGADVAARPACTSEQARRKLGLPAGPIGLFLGSAQPYRGLALLVEAMRLVSDGVRGHLAIAGPPPQAVGRHPRILPLGRVSDVGLVLGAADFLVNVNLFSLFDLSNIEAAACGKPLLLSDTGGNRALATLGAGVVPIAAASPQAIAAGLERMYLCDAEELDRMGQASAVCYREHLSLAGLAERHRRLYLGQKSELYS